MKAKFKFGIAILTVGCSALCGCNLFNKKGNEQKEPENVGKVQFWSSFGGAYTTVLNGVVAGISQEKGIEIEHTSQGSYDEINRNMISAIAVGDYPNIAMGYPDHFATYLSSGILTPLDEYLTEADLADYYSEYMNENYFYDDGGQNAQKKIYALPFNKSTELLGYNGTFVDYCATIDPSLANIPATWADWEVQGPKYNNIFTGLTMQLIKDGEGNVTDSIPGKKVYGVQNEQGRSSQFEVLTKDDPAPAGKTLLLDFEKVDPRTSVLMSWDATDNAFITLTRQWGAEYTNLPDSQKTKPAKKRVGEVLFNKPENQSKVINMLQYFNKLKQSRIFGTPQELGGSYSSDAFAQCRVMFMVCSSGGLSYNTAKWTNRFSVAPIPYKDANNKQVISQGANICLTNKGDFDLSVQVIKALTTGKFQTQWCLETGYYPCAKSAVNSQEYQDFLAEEKYYPEVAATRVAYREGSKLNTEHYMSSTEGWHKFVDPAFKGSSDLRDVVETVLDNALKINTYTDTAPYKALLDALEEAPTIKGQSTIYFVH